MNHTAVRPHTHLNTRALTMTALLAALAYMPVYKRISPLLKGTH